MIKLDKITYSYGPILAVNNFSLNINQNESLILLGPNGSGKSTLIKILAGLLFPSSGNLIFKDQNITKKLLNHDTFGIYFRTKVGIVFQNADVQLFNATVEEEIAFGPTQLKMPKNEIKDKIEAVLQDLKITHLKKRSPFALSGGEKRKVALASVLVLDPDVLLLDEPTTGLDPRSSEILINLLIDLHKKGKTIILSTHDLHFAPEVGSRVVIIGEDKRIWADGAPEKVLLDNELLVKVNLLHSHRHFHPGEGGIWHRHHHKHNP